MEDVEQEHEYVLYSVVIHRGSAGGGHYFAYIRDVYNEGWLNQSKEAKNVTHAVVTILAALQAGGTLRQSHAARRTHRRKCRSTTKARSSSLW